MNKNPSGLGERLLANFIDFFIIVLPITFVLYFIRGEYSYDWTSGITWQVIDVLYLTAVPLLWSGYSVGKHMFKIKVKRIDEQKLTLKNMLLREVVGKVLLVYMTFGISNIVSIFMVIFREDKRAIHDLIGGTYVSYDERFKGKSIF
ncbi:RDD family protein [Sporosarcina sp.]|uniref:RDD family protein n=1 Tax=Sporosarcina sp. TaxID=49982 RepID=UPI00263878AA|nr:RDD family protein [Sporosarcina sp.]